jgi:hypothetical protein
MDVFVDVVDRESVQKPSEYDAVVVVVVVVAVDVVVVVAAAVAVDDYEGDEEDDDDDDDDPFGIVWHRFFLVLSLVSSFYIDDFETKS